MDCCVGSGGKLLWVIVWRVVVICYRLLCCECCYLVTVYCVASCDNLSWVIVWRVLVILYELFCSELFQVLGVI